MGLDATVYCDCYERGVASAPPMGLVPVILETGQVTIEHIFERERLIEADRWLRLEMCEHLDGVLAHARLGTLGFIGGLAGLLNERAGAFPVLLGRVFKDGSHGGDHLSLDEVRALGVELRAVEIWLDEGAAGRIHELGEVRDTIDRLRSLRELALRVGKPIVF